VALLVATGDEYSGTLKDVNFGAVSALPCIIHRGAAGVCLTGNGSWDPEVVETCTVETRPFASRLSAFGER